MRSVMKARATVYGAVFAVGFCGLVAQVVVLREMVATFYGNELSIGVMLGSWLLWTGVGSVGLGRLARRLGRPRLWLAGALVVGAVLVVATVVGARCLGLALVASGETRGAIRPFRLMLGSSLALLAPFCLVNGLLFPLGCRVAGESEASQGVGVGRVYLAEAAGAAAGGACFSFVLVHWLGPVTIAVVLAGVWCVGAAALAATRWQGGGAKAVAGVAACGLALAAAAAGAGAPAAWARRIDRAYWRPLELVSAVDSRYGRLAVVGQPTEGGQRSLYRNGTLAFSYPDPPAAESLVHLPMLQHPGPRRVLLLGGGLGGAVEEVLKHPSVETVTVVELDPMAVRLVRGHFPAAAGRVLGERRVELVLRDGRRFLKRTDRRYDVVLVAQGPPSTAQANRYYTRECFAEAARVLAAGGVFAFRAAGGHNYIPDENRRLLASLHRTLAGVFPHVVVFPGPQCTFLASAREGMPGYRLDVLAERLAERGIATAYVDPVGWEAALVGGRLEELDEALRTPAAVNRDLAPRCYYFEAQRWGAVQRARGSAARVGWLDLGGLLAWLDRRPWVAVVAVLAVVGVVSSAVPVVRGRGRDAALSFAVASSGVVEMAVELVVLLAFQVAYGYVYQYLGVLMASFMVGLALGAWASSRWVAQGRATWRRMVCAQCCMCAYPLVLLGFVWLAGEGGGWVGPLFAGVSFTGMTLVAGLVGGLQFPVAAALHSRGGGSAGGLYALDLFGACLGALAVSAVLVPTFGMVWVCVLLGALGGLGLLGVMAAVVWGERKSG